MRKVKLILFIEKYVSINTFKNFLEVLRYYVVGLLKRLDERHLFLSAGGIAYSLLLSIIPFVLIIFAVLGSMIEYGKLEEQVVNLIDAIIPYEESATYAQNFIMSRITEVIEFKTFAGFTGILGLFFTSTWLFSSMRTTLNSIFGVRRELHALIGLLRDFGMVFLLIFFLLVSTFFLPILNILMAEAETIEFLKIFRISDLSNFIFSVLSLILIFTMFYIFYFLIPYEKLGKKVPLVGALWATILWEIVRGIFGYYVTYFLSMNKMYGAFILVIVVAFWIFYSSMLFIIGAEIAQLYRERRMALYKIKNAENKPEKDNDI